MKMQLISYPSFMREHKQGLPQILVSLQQGFLQPHVKQGTQFQAKDG